MFWDWLNNLCVWLTGINYQQLVGDTSQTAFEFISTTAQIGDIRLFMRMLPGVLSR